MTPPPLCIALNTYNEIVAPSLSGWMRMRRQMSHSACKWRQGERERLGALPARTHTASSFHVHAISMQCPCIVVARAQRSRGECYVQ